MIPKAGPQSTPDPLDCLDRVAIDVERRKIREFTRATHTQDAVVVAGHKRNQSAFVTALGLAIERGGSMRLVTLNTEWVDSTGAVAVRQRETLIELSA